MVKLKQLEQIAIAVPGGAITLTELSNDSSRPRPRILFMRAALPAVQDYPAQNAQSVELDYTDAEILYKLLKDYYG
jgi:hypothetical protein